MSGQWDPPILTALATVFARMANLGNKVVFEAASSAKAIAQTITGSKAIINTDFHTFALARQRSSSTTKHR